MSARHTRWPWRFLPLVLAGALVVAGAFLDARPAGAQPSEHPTRVLVLYGLAPEGRNGDVFLPRLQRTLGEYLPGPVEFYVEYLDQDRFPGPRHEPRLARYLADKYADVGIDVVVPIASPAVQFAADWLRPVLPGVPIVFALTFAHRVNVGDLPAGVTGRLLWMPFGPTLALARRLQPDADRTIVITGASAVDSSAVTAALLSLGDARDSTRLEIWRGWAYDSVMTALRRLSRRTIVFVAYFRRDGRGRLFVPVAVARAFALASSAPVYGTTDVSIGTGVVGGALLHIDEEAVRTAWLVIRVLRRAPGAPMPPVEFAATPLTVDWRQLARWGMDERRLPLGTEVLYRAPSTWQRHRVAILSALALMLVQAIAIGLLLYERRRRMRAQRALAEQAAYEQMIAELTVDAVRHAAEGSSTALDDAVERIARYARASAAFLLERPDASTEPLSRVRWVGAGDRAGPLAPLDDGPRAGRGARLDIPLESELTSLGVLRLYRHDGRPWTARLVGQLAPAAGLLAGALARSRAARALRRGEEVHRAVLASLAAEVAILDRAGVVVRVNEAWRELALAAGLDPDRDAFVGWSYLDECRRAAERGCDEALQVRRGLEAVLAGDRASFRVEYSWTRPDLRWYELRIDRLAHADGGAIVSHLDITDRRLAELRVEETRRQVAHLGRVAMVGELAAAMSHELRQPLTAIRANAEAGALLLARDAPPLGEVRDILADVMADDARACEVIDRIRMLLRKEEPPPTRVDVNEICRVSARLLQHDAAMRHSRIALRLAPEHLAVAGDAVQLQQVVLNLALNAMDAIAAATDGGVVTIGTAVRGERVEIAVSDTGPGLPAPIRARLFESFFSTKTQGLGLGLVIVRGIVDRHRGSVHAENGDEGGALFRVLLPRAGDGELPIVLAPATALAIASAAPIGTA